MTTMHEENRQTENIPNLQTALEQHVLLLSPTMGSWKGVYQIKANDAAVTIDGFTVDKKSVTTPRAKLMTDTYPVDADGTPWQKRITALEGQKNKVVESMSLPFPVSGIRIIARERGTDFYRLLFGDTIGSLTQRMRDEESQGHYYEANLLQDRIEAAGSGVSPTTPVFDPDRVTQSVAYQLHVLAHEFCEQLPDILSQIRSRNEVYTKVKHSVPSTYDQMRKKFYLECVPFALAGSGEANAISEQDLRAHEELVRGTVERSVTQAIETLIRGPREELASALASLQELISRNGRVTDRSFNAARTAIAKLRMFSFVANEDILTQINNLENLMGNTTTANLTSDVEARNGFNAALQSVIEEAESTTQFAQDMAAFGNRAGRSII